jgi:hypothetical protein
VPLTSHPHYLQKGPLDLIETGQGLKVQTDKPHLVSLGSGRLSTAITLLPLEEGELRAGRTRLLPALFITAYIPALEAGPAVALLPSAGNACLMPASPDCPPFLADELIKDQFRVNK